MARRFSKHNIVGSEAGEPRPIAYMRSGWRRSYGWRLGLQGVTLMAVLCAAVVLIAAFVLTLVGL